MVIAIGVQETERENADPRVLLTKPVSSFLFVLYYLRKAKDRFPYLPPRKAALWFLLIFGIHVDWKNMSFLGEILHSSVPEIPNLPKVREDTGSIFSVS